MYILELSYNLFSKRILSKIYKRRIFEIFAKYKNYQGSLVHGIFVCGCFIAKHVCASVSSTKYVHLYIHFYSPTSNTYLSLITVVFPKTHQATTYSDVADALASLESLVDFVYSGITAKITQEKSRLTALSCRIEVAQVSCESIVIL